MQFYCPKQKNCWSFLALFPFLFYSLQQHLILQLYIHGNLGLVWWWWKGDLVTSALAEVLRNLPSWVEFKLNFDGKNILRFLLKSAKLSSAKFKIKNLLITLINLDKNFTQDMFIPAILIIFKFETFPSTTFMHYSQTRLASSEVK